MPIILPGGPTPTGRTFREMLTEFYARGFTNLDDGGAGEVRAKRWLNDAMHEIDDQFDWPYLQTEIDGAAPIELTDLGRVLSVVNTNTIGALEYIDERTLAYQYADLTTAGEAQFFYLTGGTTIKTFPVSTSPLTLRYLAVSPDMSADTDRPLMPDRFRMAIVDYAVASALMDKDNVQEADAARAQGDTVVARMRDVLLMQGGAADRIVPTHPSGDW